MIEVAHISCSYGKKEILHDISFSVAEGDFCAIMGPNGSGKTTLLRCIAGLMTPETGTVKIDGINVKDYTARNLAQRIAFVRQHSWGDTDFTAFETVLMGRNPYQRRLQNESQEDWDIVEHCMKLTNTWHLRLSFPHQMSGGELQRVMIARALAQQTPILLLDEPTSSLDIAHQFEIMDLLQAINSNERKTILIVVHDLNLALRYCPQSMLLHNHSLLFHGPIAQALSESNIADAFHVKATLEDNYILLTPFKKQTTDN